tara:strand:+ start:243 stop:470 length:228 start_codon:yes stop_codon:yes gene_type:complete
MIYESQAALIEACPTELELSDFTAWAKSPEGQKIRELFAAYNFAIRTAPENIVGVGRITYAENQLIHIQNMESKL